LIDFEKMLPLLADAGVEFVIVGGLAAIVHGSARATFDLDICYSRSAVNIERLAGVLAPLAPHLRGAPKGLPFRFDAETIRRGLNFTLTTDLGDIDLLGEVSGVGSYDAASRASISVKMFGHEFRVLTLDSLIASKQAAGRQKDLTDLHTLEALRDAGADE
jgi:predicted nucleotidyltransferase